MSTFLSVNMNVVSHQDTLSSLGSVGLTRPGPIHGGVVQLQPMAAALLLRWERLAQSARGPPTGGGNLGGAGRIGFVCSCGGMGGNAPSRFPEEDGGITFVKGIRLSDRVINRMKHSSKLNPPLTPEPPTTPLPEAPAEHVLPLLTPPPPSPPSVEAVSPVKLALPSPVKFTSFPPASLESAEPPPLTESKTAPSVFTPPLSRSSPQVESPAVPDSAPPPPDVQLKIPLPPESLLSPHVKAKTSTMSRMSEQIIEAVVLPPLVESPPSPPCELMTPTSAASPPAPVESIIPPIPNDSAPAEAAALPPGSETSLVPPAESKTSRLLEPGAAPHLSSTSPSCQCKMLLAIPSDRPVKDPAPAEEESIMTTCLAPDEGDEAPEPPAAASTLKMLEEDLRQKIRADMQRSLEEEINQNRQNLQQQLEEIRAQAEAEAKAAAQAWVEEQVKKTLEEEKAAHTEKLIKSIRKEKMIAVDEKLMIQLYVMFLQAHQLEEKEKEIKQKGTLYKEHVAKLQAKCSEFYEVSAKNFQEGKEEAQKRFARFNVQPVCGDLQDQILKCYKENPGKTLTCSRIASAYMQCVDNAKKVQVNT
ncbi:transcript variant X1 [Nothobranchius furzeri]|uniref:Transcript variant X1 n=1 Tax=Nothobranchius furzeri TaxID=105023 RepID=A0A9D2YR79_NOTFU|nr:transcript variant X1 [Nothobranchius furzeri]